MPTECRRAEECRQRGEFLSRGRNQAALLTGPVLLGVGNISAHSLVYLPKYLWAVGEPTAPLGALSLKEIVAMTSRTLRFARNATLSSAMLLFLGLAEIPVWAQAGGQTDNKQAVNAQASTSHDR